MPDKTWQVLLADNDLEEALHIQDQLMRHSIQVIPVDNSADVLDALKADPPPDAVILDAKMSEAQSNGRNLLDAIRHHSPRPDLPIFLLVEPGGAVLRSSADSTEKYLRRPFNVNQFLLAAGDSGLRSPDMQSAARSAPDGQYAFYNLDDTIPLEGNTARTVTSRAVIGRTASEPSPEMGWELRKYWGVLMRRKWVLIIVTAVAILVAMVISQLLTPVYESSSTIRVASAAGGQFDYGASMLATRLANTYIEIAKSDPILDELALRLGIPKAPDIEVESVPETELLQITASHTNPEIAMNAANYLAEIMVERSLALYAGDVPTARELLEEQVQQTKADLDQAMEEYTRLLEELDAEGENTTVTSSELEVLGRQVTLRQQLYADMLMRYEEVRSAEEMRSSAITIVEYAYLPKKPASPNLMLNAILGAAAGVMGGLLLIVALESVSNKVTGSSEVQALTGLPVLAQIPKTGFSRRRVPDLRRRQALSDVFQSLQVRLQLSEAFSHTDNPVLLVTSPEPGTGKSTVATNLALSMARSDYNVILVDADLHRPMVHRIFNLDPQSGLCDVLAGSEMPEAALKNTSHSNLRILTSGDTAQYSELTGLTSVYKIRLVFAALAEKCDVVIVDAPGLLATGYSAALAKQATATLLVAAQHYTDRDTLEIALQQLRDIKANVAGIVLNKADFRQPYAYRYSRR